MGRILTLEQAVEWRRAQSNSGQVVVCTNGVFDLLHIGHIRVLQAARELGDRLLVGLNSDSSARLLKPGRPFLPDCERAELLAALACVDAVVVFSEPTAVELMRKLVPDVYVKGGDYAGNRCRPPEADIVEQSGGRTVFLPFLPGHSTSALIEHIRQLPEEGKDS